MRCLQNRVDQNGLSGLSVTQEVSVGAALGLKHLERGWGQVRVQIQIPPYCGPRSPGLNSILFLRSRSRSPCLPPFFLLNGFIFNIVLLTMEMLPVNIKFFLFLLNIKSLLHFNVNIKYFFPLNLSSISTLDTTNTFSKLFPPPRDKF